MATGACEEEEMDAIISEVERVMEDESGSGGATFGMLRMDENVHRRAGGRIVAALNAAKFRRVLTYKGDFLVAGEHDEVIITLLDPTKRVRRKQKARESKKKRTTDFKDKKDKRAEERAQRMAEQEAEKERLRKEGFFNTVDADEESDPPPPDSDSDPPPPGSDEDSDPPPPGSDDESDPPPPGSDDDSDPPPPDSDGSEPPPPGSDEESDPPPPGSDDESDPPPPGSDDEPEEKSKKEPKPVEETEEEKKKRLAEMAEWEKTLEKRRNVPTGDEKKYPYAELRMSTTKLTREDINVMKRETYLSEEEFAEVFGMTPDEFSKLPTWRKAKLKNEKDLF